VAAAAGAAFAPSFNILRAGQSPNEKVNVACIGVGQRMLLDVCGKLREHWDGGMMNIVALCDPNDRAGQNDDYARRGWEILRKELAKVPRFRDYREMFDKMRGDIDGIYLTTSHHAYFPIIMTAMHRGIHVIGHKPMCMNVEEPRVMADAARKLKNVVTATVPNRKSRGIVQMREWLDKGVLGEVREVDIAFGFYGARGHPTDETDPVPDYVDWDVFTGPAPPVPFREQYLEVRGWNQHASFSSGAAGEWGTHMFCLTQALLDLGHAESVELIDRPHGQICQWSFPPRGNLPPVIVRAYSGREMDKLFPRPKDLEPDRKLNYLHLVVTKGSDATVTSNHYGNGWRVVPESKMQDLLRQHGVPQEYEAVDDVYLDWMEAVKAGDPSKVVSGPDFYSPFLENVMLGLVACRTQKPGKKLQYDAENVRIVNDEDADKFIRREYRGGFDEWATA
jgi:hypothetical protein